MGWQCIKIDVEAEAEEEMSELLVSLGAVAVTCEAADASEIFEIDGQVDDVWARVRLTGLYNAHMDIQPVLSALGDSTQAQIHVSSLDEQDWERAWLDQFQPLQVAGNMWICPSWHEPPEPTATNVRIDPGMSFGTGTHESTRLCLKWLAELDITGKTVLDYGCGSGILAIATLKLGAGQAWATDIEHRSLAASVENARNNSVEQQLEVCLPDELHPEIRADIVVANILARTIVELSKILVAHLVPGGRLLLAGILRDQVEQVKAAFPSMRWEQQNDGEWVALLGQAGCSKL